MANQQYASVNGIAPSWSDIAIAITPLNGTKLDATDIQGIKHSGTVEVGQQKGTSGGRVMARTTGSVTYDAAGTFYKSGVRKLIDALVAVAPDSARRGNQVLLSLIHFDVDVQHTPPGETRIYHRRLKGCRLLGLSEDLKEGNDADIVELTLNPIENVWIENGVEMVLL